MPANESTWIITVSRNKMAYALKPFKGTLKHAETVLITVADPLQKEWERKAKEHKPRGPYPIVTLWMQARQMGGDYAS